VTKVIVLVIASVVALNVVLLAGAAMVAVLDRRRRRRDIRDLERLWHLAPRRPVAAGRVTRGAELHRDRSDPQGRPISLHHPEGSVRSVDPHRLGGRRLVGATVVLALAFVGTASASPRARDVVMSVFSSVSQGLGLQEATDGRASDVGAPGGASSATRTEARPPTANVDTGSGSQVAPSSYGPDPSAGVPGSSITDPGVTPLDSTTVTAASDSPSSVSLEWADVTGESGYRVERSTDGADGWTMVASTRQDVTTRVDDGLAADTTYYYRVIATTNAGDASVSDVVSATTLLEPPVSPTLSVVLVSSSEIDLGWTDVSDEAGYRVEVSLDGATWSPAGTQGADVTSFSDVGLAPDTSYWYRVIAFNAAGESAPSEPVTVSTGVDPATPSDPPTGAPAA
jgi:hypothetical protein